MAVAFSTTRPRPDLDFESESFTFDNQTFAADAVMPIFEADERAAEFDKIRTGVGADLISDKAQRREKGGRFREIDYDTVKDQFACGERGLEFKVDRRLGARNARARRRKERRGSRNLMLNVMRGREKQVIDKTVNNTTDFTLAAGNLLNAAAAFGPSSDILGEFRRAVHQTEDNTGRTVTDLVIPRQDWRTISSNTGVRGAFGDNLTKPALIPAEMLKDIIGVQEIVVPFVSYNANPRGQAASMGNLWPSGKLLFCISLPDEDLEDVQLGRTIVNTDEGSCGAGMFGSYSDDPSHSEVLWYGQDRDVKLLNANAGLVLNTAGGS